VSLKQEKGEVHLGEVAWMFDLEAHASLGRVVVHVGLTVVGLLRCVTRNRHRLATSEDGHHGAGAHFCG
jgi:hypothetical protein